MPAGAFDLLLGRGDSIIKFMLLKQKQRTNLILVTCEVTLSTKQRNSWWLGRGPSATRSFPRTELSSRVTSKPQIQVTHVI